MNLSKRNNCVKHKLVKKKNHDPEYELWSYVFFKNIYICYFSLNKEETQMV